MPIGENRCPIHRFSPSKHISDRHTQTVAAPWHIVDKADVIRLSVRQNAIIIIQAIRWECKPLFYAMLHEKALKIRTVYGGFDVPDFFSRIYIRVVILKIGHFILVPDRDGNKATVRIIHKLPVKLPCFPPRPSTPLNDIRWTFQLRNQSQHIVKRFHRLLRQAFYFFLLYIFFRFLSYSGSGYPTSLILYFYPLQSKVEEIEPQINDCVPGLAPPILTISGIGIASAAVILSESVLILFAR